MSGQALILGAFGTSTAARNTYDFFDTQARRYFPQHGIFWAFTSHMLRTITAGSAPGMESVEAVLARVGQAGYRRIVLQSLHVAPGSEYEKLAAAARLQGGAVKIGQPLLASDDDCRMVIDALARRFADPSAAVTVLVAHGSAHRGAAASYGRFGQLLAERSVPNVHLCMVEGEPSWQHMLGKIKASRLKRVKFIPLMFVAGEHMISDVLGDQADAWVRQLPGWEIDATERGLGWNEEIVRIYLDHASAALGYEGDTNGTGGPGRAI